LKQDFVVFQCDNWVSLFDNAATCSGRQFSDWVTGCMVRGSKPAGEMFFSSLKRPDWLLGLPSRQLFSGSRWWSSGRGVIATTHRHLLLRLRTRGAILYPFMVPEGRCSVDSEGVHLAVFTLHRPCLFFPWPARIFPPFLEPEVSFITV